MTIKFVSYRGIGALVDAGGDPRDGKALVASMKTITFPGMSGFVQLDENGDRYNDVDVR